MTRFGFLAATVSLVVFSTAVRASADESEVAEQLFREGHALLKEQRYAEACPKFAESELHDKASGTLLALAYCQELANALASARASYVAAAELAKAENQAERQRAATERAEALSARLSTLRVDVPESMWGLPGLSVTINGVELAQADWSHPVPKDGGSFEIEAAATNRKPWSGQVLLGAERDQRGVTVPVLAEVGPSALASPGSPGLGIGQSPPISAEPRYWTPPRIVGWAAVGAGALSGVAALYFTSSAKSAQNDVQNLLHNDESAPASARVPWDAAGHAREADGQHAEALAQGFGVAAGALLIGGAALVIFGGEKKHAETPTVSLGVVPGAARFAYSTAF